MKSRRFSGNAFGGLAGSTILSPVETSSYNAPMSAAMEYQRQTGFPKSFAYFWRQYPYPQEIRAFDLPEIALPPPGGDRATPAGFLADLCATIYGFTGATTIKDGASNRVIYEKEHFAVPSSGGLHPCSIFLGLNTDGFQGIYYYHQRRHALQQLQQGDFLEHVETATFRRDLCRDRSVILFVTAIFHRTILKYGFRSYRYLNHDAGHLLGNLRFSARDLGYRYRTLQQFDDARMCEILGIDREREEVFAVAPLDTPLPFRRAEGTFTPIRRPDSTAEITDIIAKNFPNYPYPENRSIKDATECRQLHDPVNTTPSPIPSIERIPLDGDDVPLDFREALRRRKSATSLIVGKTIPREAFADILRALRYETTDADNGFLHPYILIHNVDGLPRGLYRYDIRERALHLLRKGDFRDSGRTFAYGQNLGGGGAACVMWIGGLATAVERAGDRAIRYAYQESGILGQQLYLACAAKGVGISGIGAYLDSAILDFLGLDDGHAVVYLMGIGMSAPDDVRYREKELLANGEWIDESDIIDKGYAAFDHASSMPLPPQG